MIPCESCGRHHLSTESSCPFCKTTINPAVWAMNLLGGVATTVVLAACYGTGGFYDKPYYSSGDTFFTDTTPPTDRTDRTRPTGETGESTGDTGMFTTTGDTGTAVNTGDTGTAVNTGDTGAAVNTGDTGAAVNTGDTGTAVNTGDTGTAANTGDTGTSSFIDNDGDGYPQRWDCDDNNTSIHPDYPEQCTDGIDNDCDGLVDHADPQCP